MQQMSIFDTLYEKYKITKPIRLIELFAGYGSQALALKYLGVEFTHWRICEWATKSIQAYNDLHIRDYTDYSKDLTQDEVINKLSTFGVSMNYNKPMTIKEIKSMGVEWQRQTYNNIIATHNLVNIASAKAKDLNITDTDKYEYILSYSFPCQDLSMIGAKKGMSRDSGTRSGMLWQVERLLDECKELPQVLLMENVPQVIGVNSIKDFQEWELKLSNLGYSNYVKVLDAKNYGIPQNRERCFMVSILGGFNYNFPKPQKLKFKMEQTLDKNITSDLYMSDYYINKIKNTEFGKYHKDTQLLVNGQYNKFAVLDYRMDEGLRIRKNNCCPTITTKSNKNVTNIPLVYINGKLRNLSPRENFKLMGVKPNDFNNVAENQSNNSLCHLAGDSIVTTCLMGIFGELLGLDYETKINELVKDLKECS